MTARRKLPDGGYATIGLHEWESARAGRICREEYYDTRLGALLECGRRGLHICKPIAAKVDYHADVGMALLRGDKVEVPLHCDWQRQAAVRLMATRLWSEEAGGYVRRYNRCDIRIPRKNGKTWLMQFLATWFLTELGGVLIAVAAQTKEAAQDAIWHWMRQIGMLSIACQRHRVIVPREKAANIRNPTTHSEAVLVTADGEKLRGPAYALAVLDEVRAVAGARDWLDNAISGQGALDEGLTVTATTASDDPENYESERFLDLLAIDEDPDFEPQTLPLLWHLEEGADWKDRGNWAKVNPGLGTVKKWSAMERRFAAALGHPEDERAFRREELNEVVDEIASPVDLERWAVCGKEPDTRDGCWEMIYHADHAFAGADLSWGNDLSSLALTARAQGRLLPVWQHSWMAEARARDMDRETDGAVSEWVAAGLLDIVPEDSHAKDEEFVGFVARRMAEILQRLTQGNLGVFGYDPAMAKPAVDEWTAANLHPQAVLQGPYLNDSIARFQDEVQLGRVRHGGDKLLTHAVTRAAITRTGVRDFRQINKNISRSKNMARVDPYVAVCTALECLLKPELRPNLVMPRFGGDVPEKEQDDGEE